VKQDCPSMSKKSYEDRLEKWKNKAKVRGIKLSYQHQRIEELCAGQDHWKSKYHAEKAKSSQSTTVFNVNFVFVS